MSYKFKVWNQGHDGRTMGIRVEDVDEVARIAAARYWRHTTRSRSKSCTFHIQITTRLSC
jgi:hypothetical protein